MSCYAYKDEYVKEYFEKHSIEVMKCILDKWESMALVRKISMLLSIEEDLVRDMLVIMSGFHDIGKTFKYYQMRCIEDKCISFPKHYIVSAQFMTFLFNRAFGKLSDNYINDEYVIEVLNGKIHDGDKTRYLYTLTCVLPILLHHYAQVSSPTSFSDTIKYVKHGIYPGCYNAIDTLIQSMQRIVKTNFAQELLEEVKQVIRDNETLGIYLSTMLDPGTIIKKSSSYILVFERLLVEAITGVLNMCDGKVALKNRVCEKKNKEY